MSQVFDAGDVERNESVVDRQKKTLKRLVQVDLVRGQFAVLLLGAVGNNRLEFDSFVFGLFNVESSQFDSRLEFLHLIVEKVLLGQVDHLGLLDCLEESSVSFDIARVVLVVVGVHKGNLVGVVKFELLKSEG